MRIVALAVSMLCFVANAYGLTPPPLKFKEDAIFDYDFQVFPVSSEMQIGKIQTMLQRAPKGAYLTVGGERSFRAGSMMPHMDYLIQLDVASDIVRFNLINKELLKAPTRADYKHLRWAANFLDWKDFAAQQSENGVHVKLSEEDYQWWLAKIRDLDNMQYPLPESLNRFHEAPPCGKGKKSYEKNLDLATVLDYKSGNYIFYDDLYENIHRLAKEERILTMQINLMDTSQVAALVEYLKRHNLTLSVLDLDNLYFRDYLGQDTYHQLINLLTPLTQDDSILLVMSNYRDYACGQFQIYYGFRMSQFKTWPPGLKMQTFVDGLPQPVHDLIDGKLFEADEKLPPLIKP